MLDALIYWPKAKSQKPKAKSQKPKAKSQKPKAKIQKPKAKNQKPKTKNQALVRLSSFVSRYSTIVHVLFKKVQDAGHASITLFKSFLYVVNILTTARRFIMVNKLLFL
jgi:hypothetical protein